VLADMLTALLVRGEQHPLVAAVLSAQAMQQTCTWSREANACLPMACLPGAV
jgi:hypothetical protein